MRGGYSGGEAVHYLSPLTAQPADHALPRRSLLRLGLAGAGLAGMASAVLGHTGLISLAAQDAIPGPLAPGAVPPAGGQAFPSLTEAGRRDWALFKANLLMADGRIVDTGNHGVSHSEGQGIGLLFAVAFDDRPAFDAILGWTRRRLLRDDGLHAWRFIPDSPTPVSDPNNATDGDIYIAGALQRAARRWGSASYAAAAARTAAAIHDTLLEQAGDRLLLLPGQAGFTQRDRVVVNLSYYVFPLLAELNLALPSPRWAALQRDGLALIRGARFGRWHLPPDWLEVSRTDGTLRPAESFPQRFSWDAVRIPLFLAWSGFAPEIVQSAVAFWRASAQRPPAWVDLRTGMVAEYAAPPGVVAIASIAAQLAQGRRDIPATLSVESDAYYSAAMTILSRIACCEAPAVTS